MSAIGRYLLSAFRFPKSASSSIAKLRNWQPKPARDRFMVRVTDSAGKPYAIFFADQVGLTKPYFRDSASCQVFRTMFYSRGLPAIVIYTGPGLANWMSMPAAPDPDLPNIDGVQP